MADDPLRIGGATIPLVDDGAFRIDPGRGGRLVANPPDESRYAVRWAGPDGTIYGLDRAGVTVLESFEDGEWPGEWADEVEYYQLTTDAITGSYSLECTDDYRQVAHTGVTTTRDATYACRTVVSQSGAQTWLLTNCQDLPGALRNSYAARLGPDIDALELIRRVDGSATTLASQSVSLSYGVEYQVALALDGDQLRARVFDASGTELASTSWVTDTTHSGGYLGVYTDGTNAAGTRHDEFTRRPVGVGFDG